MSRTELQFQTIKVCCCDSIAEATHADVSSWVVSGSHGGLSAAHYAIAIRPVLTVFNDAGIGREQAGIAGLSLMQNHGLAACAVSHQSACIGVALSTWEHGVISHANPAALALGVQIGQSLISCFNSIDRL